MHLIRYAVLFLGIICVYVPADGAAGGSRRKVSPTASGPRSAVSVKTVGRMLSQLLDDSVYRNCFIGCRIVTAGTGRTLFDRNGEKLFHPASTLKLITSAAAYSVLPPDYRFVTPLSADKPVQESVLPGNLYITGSGDPLLDTADLDTLVSRLVTAGIRRIEGDIVGDISLFDSLRWGHGWMWDDEPDPDEAFLTPLTIEGNSIGVTVEPDPSMSGKVRISFNPGTTYFTVDNSAMTSADTAGKPLNVSRIRGTNVIQLYGTLHPHAAAEEYRLSVWKPEMYLLHLLRERLQNRDITIGGTLRFDINRGSIRLAEISHPLDSVIYRMNKKSDNIAAENLLRILSLTEGKAPASAERGLSVVGRYCSAIGIDTARIRLADGSGVSWYNELSPAAMTKILTVQYNRRSTFGQFYKSLPVAGMDGTLQHRMTGTGAAGNVRAKTGSLTGNSALAGYVRTADGTLLVFSIMINHYPGDVRNLRHLQDRIMEYLAGVTIKAK